MGRLESCGSVSMKTEDARLQLTHIKREPEDEELDWSESLLLSEDRLEEDPEGSQSQAEQKISEENTCGMLRAAEGPLCEEEEEEEEEEELRVELKQDPEGWPLAPPPNLMQVHCVWSEAGGLGTLPEKHGPRGGKEKQRDVQGNLGCCEEFQRATPGKKFFGRNDPWDPGDGACEEVHSEAGGRPGGDGLPPRTPSPETDRPARAEDEPPGRGRRPSKKQYCLYCQKGYSKISRHLEHVHRGEPDVASAVRFPKRSEERRARLAQLRNQGNFVHNSAVARTGAGELVVRRRFGPKRELGDLRYCPYCKGLFAKPLLWRHVKGCQLRAGAGRGRGAAAIREATRAVLPGALRPPARRTSARA
ncbi:hypothetical protein COCON_G00101450 [Conger conger]|uniref:Uncharacterized protein n=1 Tax=Conger conger TaxID=82655 RepID=A0A9Q1HXE9_CONCO|nr:hypothetical protein COCON_G00101450 [Conger conger]